MPISNNIENFEMTVRQDLVNKARELTPELFQECVRPVRTVDIEPEGGRWAVRERKNALPAPLGRGDSLCADFGDHCVGYVSFKLVPVGSPPDAPAYLYLKLGEAPCEIGEDFAAYDGMISRSWLQEEFLHVDTLPAVISLPRRYAFRYFQIKVLDTSSKYKVIVKDLSCRCVTSADWTAAAPAELPDEELAELDRVSLKTLADCMQLVFEDGPKRDRRLWLGDMRLQALTNYVSFKNYDLVKRCLYLFAGLTQNEGRVGACLFCEPAFQVDDTFLFDYSLFFVSCLEEYVEASGDEETLRELYPTARRQLELALDQLDEDGVVRDKDTWWCFLDWTEGLNKQAGAQAVLLCALRQGGRLASRLGLKADAELFTGSWDRCAGGAVSRLWDEDRKMFVSGAGRQVSWASQVWFALSGIFDREKSAALLKRTIEMDTELGIVTPYMYHYFIEALFRCGERELGEKYLRSYWGAMLRDGADTFYEVFDENDPNASPYGSPLINSRCHAWSCTPAYFIRKYLI